jgi:hypothetical protein
MTGQDFENGKNSFYQTRCTYEGLNGHLPLPTGNAGCGQRGLTVFENPPLFNPSPLLMLLLFPIVVLLLPPNMLPPGTGLVALFSRGPMRGLLLVGNWFKLADFLTSDSARAGGCCCCCWRAWASSCSLSNLQEMIT